MSRTRKLPAALVLAAGAVAAAALATGCDDNSGQVESLEKDVAGLRAETKRLETERDRLASRLENAERRMAGLHEDLMQVRKDAMSASADASSAAADAAKAVDAGAAPAAASAPAKPKAEVAADAKELAEYYATDEGRRVFEVAMKAYETKQQDDRRDQMVKGMMDAFATKANLSPQQVTSMEKIVGKAMTDMTGLWRTIRDGDGGTPEERAARRTEAVAKAEEIRRETEDQVRGVLDASQFEMFQQDSARMRGMLGGGMMGGGGGGRPGGFGGQRGQ